jgi:Na+-driven multidrug efflux pump
MWRILRIGIPAMVMSLQRSFGNFILTWFIAPFGTLAVAAHSLVARVEMFLFLPGTGFGIGSGVLIGQNLGAGRPDRAQRNGWLAVVFLEVVMVVFAAVIFMWAEYVIGIFTSEAALIEMGSLFLRIATAAFAVMGCVTVLQQSLSGAGDTVSNMIISITMLWVVQLPLAYMLSRYTNLEVLGIRWAMVAGMLAGAIFYTVYFKTGRWKTRKV